MIRGLVFIFIFFNFINANDIFKPLFPNGEKIQNFVLNSPIHPINNLMLHSGDFLITFEGDYQTKLRIWDIQKKKIIFQLNNINSDSKQLALSKDDRYLIYDDNSYIVLFDIKQKKIKKKIKIDNIISSFDISNDGKYIVISTSNKLMLYEIKTNQFLYKKTSSSGKQIIISKKNDYFTLLNNKYIKLIELKSGKELFSFSLENIKKIDISKDEKFIIAISDDTIYKLNILDKTIDRIDTKGSLEDVKIFDNKLIITAGRSHLYGLNIWNLETKEKVYTGNNTGSLKNISLSTDNKYLSAIQKDTTALYIINMFTLKLFNLNGLKNTKKGIYSKKTKEIFSIGKNEKGIKDWDLKENILKNSLDDNLTILDICLSQNEELLVYACRDDNYKTEIKIYNMIDKKIIYSFEEKNTWDISNLVINKNLIAYSTIYSKIKILDINKSKIIQELSYDDYIYDLKFLDKYIVISSSANLKVIDIRSKKIVNQIVKNNNSYLSLYSNPNFYSIRNYSKGTFEVRELLTNKKVFSTEKYIDDIVGNLVFIDDYKQGQVWDLKEKKYINKLKENFYSIDTGEKIILTRLNDNKIINKIFYKKNNRWLIEDTINKKVYRYMDKNFYLNSKTFKSILPIKSKKIKKNDIDIFVAKNELKLINYQIDNFDIQIENLTDKPIYDISFRVDDENFLIFCSEPLVIEPHSIKKIPISIQFNNQLKNSFSKDVNLEVLVNGLFQKISLKLNVIKKDIKELEVESLNTLSYHYTNDNFEIKIKNLTNYDLRNVQVTIYYHNKIVKENQLNIDANSSNAMTFRMDKNISKDGFFNTVFYKFNDNEFNVTLQTSLFKSYKSTENIKVSFEDFHVFLMLFIFIPFVLTIFLHQMIYLKEYNRFIKKIENNPYKIFEAPFDKLNYYRKILKRRIKRYKFDREENKILNEIFDNDFDRVARFFEVSNMEKAQIISDKVNGKLKKLEDNFFEIKLDKNFAIKVEKFLLYFSEDIAIERIYKTLKKEQNKPILLIAKNEKEQKILNENNKLSELKNVIAILPKDLKIFLLEKNHSLYLSKILSTKLDRKLISPYNLKGGVQNESYFFGREKIINNILNRELSNYLIVGARQIGKTSLLIALERIFKQRDELVTIAITLSGNNNIIKRIALKLKLDSKSTLEEVEEYILTSNKTYLFLIDEVDGFIKNEEKTNYKILDTFRSLTQDRQAYFIMAGFWELYAQVTYDYQSPIKNFGEVITIDKLEDEACIDLVFKPMEALNLRYKNIEKDAVYMIQSLGKRANLIATVANQIVENLEPYRYEINAKDIDKALNSRSVIDNFSSWKQLTNDEFKSSIDKFIVYHTIGLDSFTIRKIINFFKKLDVDKVTIEEIQESLDRLELSYILAKNGRTYFYTIPLFQEHLQRDDIKAILDEMIDEFRREYGE